jgi:hypothetical protein
MRRHLFADSTLPEALMIGLKKQREPKRREPRILPVDELRQHFLGACCRPATIVMKWLSAVLRDARASLLLTPYPPRRIRLLNPAVVIPPRGFITLV